MKVITIDMHNQMIRECILGIITYFASHPDASQEQALKDLQMNKAHFQIAMQRMKKLGIIIPNETEH